jgi:hypothetical protein
MEKHLIDSAKEYAKKNGKPLSRLVADFFQILKNSNAGKEISLPPTVASLKGVLKGSGTDKEDYKKYLEEKYL